jgi:hypothetical protein
MEEEVLQSFEPETIADLAYIRYWVVELRDMALPS